MAKKAWISRRGQADAAQAVELVLERQPQEPIQQIADALIDDSPYQARQPISPVHVAELAQGMTSAGFHGVVIVRPHPEQSERFQLVYGHRRRIAWRQVCQEQGIPCMLPVVVRTITDVQMLTIGAQENLQRQDLDPVEEGQIVAWLERMYFDKNQAEIGALLGKSSDWVSTRSRIHRLPEPLKALLRQRPRAIGQALELGVLAQHDPERALHLTTHVIAENMSLDDVRSLIRTSAHADHGFREKPHNRRDVTTSVQSITNTPADFQPTLDPPPPGVCVSVHQHPPELPAPTAPQCGDRQDHDETADEDESTPTFIYSDTHALQSFQKVVQALEEIAHQARDFPADALSLQTLARAERALTTIRHTLSRNWMNRRRRS